MAILAMAAAACLPPPPPPPPAPPPPPPLPNAPVGQAAPSVAVDFQDARGIRAIDFPDPFILRVDNPPAPPVSVPENPPPSRTYFAYSTGSGFVTAQVIQSTDLNHWMWVGDVFAVPGRSAWAELFGFTWAPSVLERPANPPDKRFVLYYTARSLVPSSAGYQCIGRAVSAYPQGPFTDDNAGPLVCTPDRGGSVDPNPIVVDGAVYLLWQSHGILPAGEPPRLWSVPLTPDGLAIAGAHSLLLTVQDGSFESPVIEGPSMMPAPGGGFLLFYSANLWRTADYKVAVAWCQTPSGGCARLYATPLVATTGSMAGPGGESVFQDANGSWFMAFHAWTAPFIDYVVAFDSRYARSLRILPISFPSGDHYPKVG
jgi:Glycosyl hydrolases family 43